MIINIIYAAAGTNIEVPTTTDTGVYVTDYKTYVEKNDGFTYN